jgi:hypothetical protein
MRLPLVQPAADAVKGATRTEAIIDQRMVARTTPSVAVFFSVPDIKTGPS